MLEGKFGVPAAGGVLVPVNIRLAPAEVELHPRALGRALRDRRPRAGRLVEGAKGVEVIVDGDTGDPGDAYEQFLRSGSPSFEPVPVTDEEDVISVNYTSGTTGQPEGRHGHAPRGVSQRSRRDHRDGSRLRLRLPVGAADVPLQRLVPPLGGHRRRRAAMSACAGSSRRASGSCSRPRASPTPAARPPSTSRSSTIPPRGRSRRAVTVSMGGAPPSPTLLERMSELNFRPKHLYGLTETYGPCHDLRLELRTGTTCPLAERARLLARQGHGHVTHQQVRVVDERLQDVAQGRRRRSARSSCAGTTSWPATSATPRRPSGRVRRRLVPLGRSSPSGIPTATSSSATARRTSSSPAARTSRRSRSSRSSSGIRRCSSARSWPCPTSAGASGRRRSYALKPGSEATEQRDHRLLPGAARALQVPGRSRVRRAAEDLDGQDPEVRPARAGVGGTGKAG